MRDSENRDIQNIKQGKDIATQTLKMMRGENNDVSLLYKLTKDNSKTELFVSKMSDGSYLEAAIDGYASKNKKENLQKLMSQVYERKRRSTIKKISIFSSSIAAAVCIISFLIFQSDDTQPKQQISNIEISSSIKVPTLITELGEKIELKNQDAQFNIIGIDKSDARRLCYNNTNAENINDNDFHTIVIPRQYVYNVKLSDGTEVTLNSGSKLKYPKHFNNNIREVYLEGEAYFNVSKSKIPFIVNTEKFELTVYGTEFNINLNKKSTVEAVLIEGSVGLRIKNDSIRQEYRITPNQIFALDTNTGEHAIKNIDCNNYIGWRHGSFKCERDKLSNIIDNISAWYGVTFHYSSDDVSEMLISVDINMNLSINHVIEILEAITERVIINEGNNVYMIK